MALRAIPAHLSSKKTRSIWLYFTANLDDQCIAACNTCEEKVSHGKTLQHFNTTNLIYHLKMKHMEDYSKYMEIKSKESQPMY